MDLGHYTAGYKLYHKVAVPEKTDTLKPNFTINLLSKLAWGQKSSHYIKDNANCKPFLKVSLPVRLHRPHSMEMNIS